MKKIINFIMLLFCFGLYGCNEPEQTTVPGQCGHKIYQRENGGWNVIAVYLNDSLIIMGNPNVYLFNHPIVNIKTGKIIDEIKYSPSADKIKIKGNNNTIN